MTTNTTFKGDPDYKDAVAKLTEVFDYGKPFVESGDILEKTAQYFHGDVCNTGGGIMVTIIKFGKHFAIGVTDECVVLYWDPDSEDKYVIFWEAPNDEASHTISMNY